MKSVTVSEDLLANRDRLILDSAVTVLYASGAKVRVTVRGDTRTYRVSRDTWDAPLRCSCKAAEYGRLCKHAAAAALVLDGPWRDSEAAA